MSGFIRDQKHLTANEKIMIVRVHLYLKDFLSRPKHHRAVKLRREVAEACGIGEATVGRIISEFNKENSVEKSKGGGPRGSRMSDDIVQEIQKIVNHSNAIGRPLSLQKIRSELNKESIDISKETLRRQLIKIGLYYGKGERRNILHETVQNVAFRARYLRHRMANLNANQLPQLPEIFLDESYCHVDHQQKLTWLPKGGVVHERGRGKMLVIFGAIAIFRNSNSNFIRGEIVKESLHIWDPTIRANMQPNLRRRGRPRLDREQWETVPEVVLQSNIAPTQVDYHGNFTADIFEDLFSKLCESLQNEYGDCHIHMDGAKYHKRRSGSIPTSSSRKEVLIQWLQERGVEFDRQLLKPELLKLVQEQKKDIPFTCVEIASSFGHVVYYTPPYHCELQPIEKVWGIAKNSVAATKSDRTIVELRNDLLQEFAKMTSGQIVSCWKKAVKNAIDYFQNVEEVVPLNESEASSGSESDHDD
jgi:transposase